MTDWLDTYAHALEGRLGDSGGGLAVPRELRNPLLRLARIVAHSSERKNAPLATYVAARYVARRAAEGVDHARAVEEAVAVAEEVSAGAPG
ncbi:MAG TPA: DUF6457 domain-containing protein [Actinomycetota bacterium]|nr:DUF6457 domain-containing protein [Actinomycetota bacterium]